MARIALSRREQRARAVADDSELDDGSLLPVVQPSAAELSGVPTGSSAPSFILKKLSQKHKNMISLALQGNRREVVAEACGCTPEYVSMILRQPLAKGYIKELEEYLDIRMRGLLEKTVDAVDVGLQSKSVETRLKAAKLQLQVTGKLEPDEATKATAEDLVMNILNVGGTVMVRS